MPEKTPRELHLLGSFVNTLEKEFNERPDEEALDSPEALRGWMRDHGIPVADPLDEQDLQRATDFREALRRLLRANNGATLDSPVLRQLREAADSGLIRVEVDSQGRAVTVPANPGLGALFARLLAAVADSQAAGTWERMKACAADDCEWAFFDESKNRSRTWCSMEVCGNRAKTRAYRARRKQD